MDFNGELQFSQLFSIEVSLLCSKLFHRKPFIREFHGGLPRIENSAAEHELTATTESAT